MPGATRRREIRIHLRLGAQQRDLIDLAAAAQRQTRNQFVVQAACERAEQVLLNQVFFRPAASRLETFARALDAPLQPNAAVALLLAKVAPWDR